MRENRGITRWPVVAALSLMPMVSSAEESETLTQLLQEVRLLRQAIERSTEFASRTQLLTAQLSVQERRLSRAQTELEGIARELQAISAEHPRYENIQEELERALHEERDPERRQQIEFEQKQIQTQIGQTRERSASSHPVGRAPPRPSRSSETATKTSTTACTSSSGSWRGVGSRYCGFCSLSMPMRASRSSGSS